MTCVHTTMSQQDQGNWETSGEKNKNKKSLHGVSKEVLYIQELPLLG